MINHFKSLDSLSSRLDMVALITVEHCVLLTKNNRFWICEYAKINNEYIIKRCRYIKILKPALDIMVQKIKNYEQEI